MQVREEINLLDIDVVAAFEVCYSFGPEFESRTQLVVTDCELLRFEDCIFAPQSCKCYGNLSSKVD